MEQDDGVALRIESYGGVPGGVDSATFEDCLRRSPGLSLSAPKRRLQCSVVDRPDDDRVTSGAHGKLRLVNRGGRNRDVLPRAPGTGLDRPDRSLNRLFSRPSAGPDRERAAGGVDGDRRSLRGVQRRRKGFRRLPHPADKSHRSLHDTGLQPDRKRRACTCDGNARARSTGIGDRHGRLPRAGVDGPGRADDPLVASPDSEDAAPGIGRDRRSGYVARSWGHVVSRKPLSLRGRRRRCGEREDENDGSAHQAAHASCRITVARLLKLRERPVARRAASVS